jgi:hypothetical protein
MKRFAYSIRHSDDLRHRHGLRSVRSKRSPQVGGFTDEDADIRSDDYDAALLNNIGKPCEDRGGALLILGVSIPREISVGKAVATFGCPCTGAERPLKLAALSPMATGSGCTGSGPL